MINYVKVTTRLSHIMLVNKNHIVLFEGSSNLIIYI